MVDARDTQRLFDAGVVSLGIPIGGPGTACDIADQFGLLRPENLLAMMAK
ncbi:Uncharacterised protein [Mycobacteroides abscessus subsp. bolletii]|uniref:Uncharacterized protein n=1 Tax=Mycobacteroides abscessus subsp. bolletii TaxID=319705 RepID=A0A9Q7SGN9_9MYCO|nr:hypothetical protein [Mycobacteroides abscessus]AMU19891.1 hypothetical protein A3N95_02940 [Mycobacteroides abscessus]MBN7300639.1 hypothetical protein [Mycobacteroides abscessus subsp. bolletii]MBN7455491.1 hypothetical protein [Mycobacteroides abscessus subsp. abscessus]MBN7545560.1 hypothetical protein [Mycobacteroides abscessus subsp. abscessus]MBN7569452.1 hypothetical protein [Mycobacteroides abscessus subsp. abscessus]